MLSIKKLLTRQAALVKLLQYKGVSIDSKTISEEFEKHPDSKSLLAVCDVLDALSISNRAFRIDFGNLEMVPCPFLAHLNTTEGEVVAVTRVDADSIYISTDQWENHKLSKVEFAQKFSGVVVTVEPTAAAKAKKTLKDKMASLRLPALFAMLALALLLALFFHSSYFANIGRESIALSIFKSAGLITAVLLLIQSVDSNNPLVQAICQNKGKTNCNAILSSDAAKVFEGVSWSEVGFFYFAGTWLMLLFGNGPQVWPVMALLNVVSLPYTFYSIYYQARIAKQWCVLCCTIQALLWLEFIPLFSVAYHNSFSVAGSFSGAVLSTAFICLVMPIALWIILKPLLQKNQQLPVLKEQLRDFKYNAEVFTRMLTDQPKYVLPAEDWCIVLGSAEAENVFTVATNPYCPPCARMHGLLDELLSQNGNVQARIIFSIPDMNDGPTVRISRHLMALNRLPDKDVVKHALHDWYAQKQKNYDAWAKRYPAEFDEAEINKLDKQTDWCMMADINATPTVLLNGYRMPKLYQLPDLKYMLN